MLLFYLDFTPNQNHLVVVYFLRAPIGPKASARFRVNLVLSNAKYCKSSSSNAILYCKSVLAIQYYWYQVQINCNCIVPRLGKGWENNRCCSIQARTTNPILLCYCIGIFGKNEKNEFKSCQKARAVYRNILLKFGVQYPEIVKSMHPENVL
jgi:hypothetical protein